MDFKIFQPKGRKGEGKCYKEKEKGRTEEKWKGGEKGERIKGREEK